MASTQSSALVNLVGSEHRRGDGEEHTGDGFTNGTRTKGMM